MKKFFVVLLAVALFAVPVYADNEISANGMSQGDQFKFMDYVSGSNGLMNPVTAPLFAWDTTTKSVMDTGAAIRYAIDGALYSAAQWANQALSIAAGYTGTVAAGYTRQFFLSLNSSGTLAVRSGAAATTVAGAARSMPLIPVDEALVSVIQVTVNSDGATWTLGTSTYDHASSSVILIDAAGINPNAFKMLDK